MITSLGDKKLTTDNEDYWIAPDANIIGSVHLAKDTSVWFTSLVSKKETIESLQKSGEKLKVKTMKIIPMHQGNKITRIVAWQF